MTELLLPHFPSCLVDEILRFFDFDCELLTTIKPRHFTSQAYVSYDGVCQECVFLTGLPFDLNLLTLSLSFNFSCHVWLQLNRNLRSIDIIHQWSFLGFPRHQVSRTGSFRFDDTHTKVVMMSFYPSSWNRIKSLAQS
jgi:hypothetical protein